jgi:hypothetical protein
MNNLSGYNNIPGAPGNLLSQRVYGPIERGLYNRPMGEGIVQPEVFMAPYPGRRPGQPTEYFPLGNPAAGYRFQGNLPGTPGNAAGMANAQFYTGSPYTQSQLPGDIAYKTVS